MGKLQRRSAGFTIVEVLVLLFVVIILATISLLVIHANTKPDKASSSSSSTATNKSAPSTNSSYAILSPATVPSKTPECSQTLTYQSNGNSEPVKCANGYLNTLEWNALAALEPKVMTLGYGATESQVQTDLCSDASDSDSDANTGSSNVIEDTTYQISALYYGWNFSSDPSVVLRNGTC
ncbi:MAG TPA: hypothetical protein VMR18_03150 [Candidatus Saccharimonadales bacterium]|nr:hypothetical protein [Candidatus Saccharimonadales bacterium]